jgi:hypothetical protein
VEAFMEQFKNRFLTVMAVISISMSLTQDGFSAASPVEDGPTQSSIVTVSALKMLTKEAAKKVSSVRESFCVVGLLLNIPFDLVGVTFLFSFGDKYFCNSQDLFRSLPLDEMKEIFKCLIAERRGINPLFVNLNPKENTALTLINRAYPGDIDGVNILLAFGADINSSGRSGDTALHAAARGARSLDLIERLVFLGAVFSRDSRGKTVLHEVVGGESPLTVRTDIIKWLIDDCGLLIDDIDVIGRTPLHLAVMGRNDFIVRELLRLGANCIMRDNHGKIARDYVSSLGSLGFAYELLIKEERRQIDKSGKG